jgi:hypothetical protein
VPYTFFFEEEEKKAEGSLGDEHPDPLLMDSIHPAEGARRHVAVIYCWVTGNSETLAMEFL